MLELLFAGGFIFLFYVFWNRRNALLLRDKLGVPGPSTNFLLGNIHQLAKSEAVHETFVEWKKKYGSIFGYYAGPKLYVAVHDPEIISDILIKKFASFSDRMTLLLTDNGALGEGILALHGEHWRSVRNSLSPSFSTVKIKQMQQTMAEKVEILMSKFKKKAEVGEDFDVYDDVQALTLDVIGKCALAVNCTCQTNAEDLFLKTCQQYFREADFKKNYLFFLDILFPSLDRALIRLKSWTAFGKAEDRLTECLHNIYYQRKIAFKEFEGTDLLQLMLHQMNSGNKHHEHDAEHEANGNNNCVDIANGTQQSRFVMAQLTDKIIIGNCYTFLLAGYETTSTALGYTFWLLAKYPEVQKKLQQEIDSVYVEREAQGQTILDYDTIHKLPYLDAVMKETLRYLPPVTNFVARTCVEECTVAGIRFVPGVQVVVPVYSVHRDPELWPNPDEFLPERFLGDQKHHPMAWIPFGAGPRNCIGMRFAILEYKLCISRVLRNYSIQKGPRYQETLNLGSVNTLLRPLNGVLVKLVKRNGG